MAVSTARGHEPLIVYLLVSPFSNNLVATLSLRRVLTVARVFPWAEGLEFGRLRRGITELARAKKECRQAKNSDGAGLGRASGPMRG